MSGGYRPGQPPTDLAWLITELDTIEQRLLSLERPTGEASYQTVSKLTALVSNIQTQLDAYNASRYTNAQINALVASPGNIAPVNVAATGAISAAGAVTAGGSGTFPGGLSSSGAYGTDVSTMSGARQSVWQHNSGVYGYAPSSITKKTNFRDVPFSASDVLAVAPYVFQYKAQIEIRTDPENEWYDPAYVPTWEIGLMAEHLVTAGLGAFVFYEEDGTTPKGINYDLFGAVAGLVVGRNHEDRLQRLEARS